MKLRDEQFFLNNPANSEVKENLRKTFNTVCAAVETAAVVVGAIVGLSAAFGAVAAMAPAAVAAGAIFGIAAAALTCIEYDGEAPTLFYIPSRKAKNPSA